MNITRLLLQYLISFGWAITGAISMAVSLAILVKIFSWISPINEWKELEKGNMSVAVFLSAIVLGTALVISFTLS